MGVNLPIRRIVFTELSKYDGEGIRPLTAAGGQADRRAPGGWAFTTWDTSPRRRAARRFSKRGSKRRTRRWSRRWWAPARRCWPSAFCRFGLALWSTREEPLPHYRKMDVRAQLLILDRIAHYRLAESIQWRLIMLPFDVNSEDLMGQFLSYVEARFVRGEEKLTPPAMQRQDLGWLEGYYQGVNLYCAFSAPSACPLTRRGSTRPEGRSVKRSTGSLTAGGTAQSPPPEPASKALWRKPPRRPGPASRALWMKPARRPSHRSHDALREARPAGRSPGRALWGKSPYRFKESRHDAPPRRTARGRESAVSNEPVLMSRDAVRSPARGARKSATPRRPARSGPPFLAHRSRCR